MCLAIPGQVIDRLDGYADQLILVDIVGGHRKVNIGMLEDADQEALGPGDWVIIHMGFVIERCDAAGAERAMAGLELMGRARDAQTGPAA